METVNTTRRGHCSESTAPDVDAVATKRDAGSAKSITSAFSSAT